MESINKVCAKFRKKTLKHRELMETVFTGASTTVWERSHLLIRYPHEYRTWIQILHLNLFRQKKGKRKKTPSTSVSKLKKATSRASVIAKSMNNLTNVVHTQNQQITARHLTGNESLYTISECMQRLTNITSLLGTPLFHFASTLMDNANYQEVIMCQPVDDHIINWLTQKQLQCSASMPFANLFGARRM